MYETPLSKMKRVAIPEATTGPSAVGVLSPVERRDWSLLPFPLLDLVFGYVHTRAHFLVLETACTSWCKASRRNCGSAWHRVTIESHSWLSLTCPEPALWMVYVGRARLARIRHFDAALLVPSRSTEAAAIAAVALGLGNTLASLGLSGGEVPAMVLNPLRTMSAMHTVNLDIESPLTSLGRTPLSASVRNLTLVHRALRLDNWVRLEWAHWSSLTRLRMEGQLLPLNLPRAFPELEHCRLTLSHDDEPTGDCVRRGYSAVVQILEACGRSQRLTDLHIGWPTAAVIAAAARCASITRLGVGTDVPIDDTMAFVPLTALTRLRSLQFGNLEDGASVTALLPSLARSLFRLVLRRDAPMPGAAGVTIERVQVWTEELTRSCACASASVTNSVVCHCSCRCSIDLTDVVTVPAAFRKCWGTAVALRAALVS